MYAQQIVEFFKLAPGEFHGAPPNLPVFTIALLQFHQLFSHLRPDVFSRRLQTVNLPVEPHELPDRILLQGGLVEEMLPAVNQSAELGAPVAEVVVRDHLVTQKAGDSGQTISEDRAANMADVHRFGHVRRTEIDDDPFLGAGGADAEPFISRDRGGFAREEAVGQPEIDESRSGHVGDSAMSRASISFDDIFREALAAKFSAPSPAPSRCCSGNRQNANQWLGQLREPPPSRLTARASLSRSARSSRGVAISCAATGSRKLEVFDRLPAPCSVHPAPLYRSEIWRSRPRFAGASGTDPLERRKAQ